MENQSVPEPARSEQPKLKKHSAKHLLCVLISVLLILGAAGGVYMWQQNKIDEQVNNLASVQEELAKANANQKDTSKSDETVSNSEVKYSAKVGKFTLTLPTKYGVVILQDSAGEGVPITKLSVPSATSANGVYENIEVINDVNIEAVSLKSLNSTYEAQVKAALKDSVSTKVNTSPNFAGVVSQQYSQGGMGNPQIVFFNKGDIMYTIKLADKNEVATQKLQAIAKGFSFN